MKSLEHVQSSPLWFTCTTESPNVCASKLCSTSISLLVQPFTRTDFSRRAFRFSATLCLLLSLGLKLFSLKLSLNTDPTHFQQRLWSYNHMMLYKFDYYYYYWYVCLWFFSTVGWAGHLACKECCSTSLQTFAKEVTLIQSRPWWPWGKDYLN